MYLSQEDYSEIISSGWDQDEATSLAIYLWEKSVNCEVSAASE